MKLSRPVIFVGALAPVVIAVLGVLLLPWLIDSRLVRDKIDSELVRHSLGSVTFGKIGFQWFPRPYVVIDNAEFSVDDRAWASIRSAEIYPALFHLLTGRWVVRRARLLDPKLRIRLPQSSAKPFELEQLEKQLRSGLARFTSALPTARIDISGGSAEITIGDKPRVILENIAAQTIGSPGELRLGLSARSNLWEQIKVDGKILLTTLASEIDIGVRKLEIRDVLAILAPESSGYAEKGAASLAVHITSVGLRQFQASVDAYGGPFVFTRRGGAATVEAKRLKAGITYQAGAIQVEVEKLDLGSPRLQASGELKIRSGWLSTRIQVRDVDMAQLSDLALRIADDHDGVRIAQRYASAGTIPEATIQSAGASFAKLVSSENLAVSGSLRGGKIFIPGPDLELTNVAGSARYSNGILEADGVSANLGATKGWNGKLLLGFKDKTAPFHLDILLNAGAPEVHSILLKVVRDEVLRDELSKLEKIEGELSGRLILGERLGAIAPIVAISKADLRANYAPIPFPVAIRGGWFRYDRSSITLENAQASVGRSRLGELGVTFHRDGSRKLRVGAQQATLDLQQIDTMLRSFEGLRGYFTKLESARGEIEAHKLSLAGAYDDPAGWVLESTGSFSRVEMQHKDLPDRLTLARGKFAASEGRLLLTDTAASISDASFISDGNFEYKRGIPIRFETRGKGSIGPRMTQWLSRYIELPEDVKLRAPLTIAAERFTWRDGGDVSFEGQVSVAGGPQLILEVVKQPQGFTMPNLTIQDGDRRARMTAQRAKDKLEVSFSGEVTEHTFDKVFTSFPTQPVSLQGDIAASVSMSDPSSVSARGHLSGSHLTIPFGTDKVLVDNFRLDANGDSVVIQSADFRWGQSRFTASGQVAAAKDLVRLDLDVAVDQFDWEKYQRAFGAESSRQRPNNTGVMSIPGVEGRVRLKAGRVTFERFNLSALEAIATIARSGIRADIVHGIACGITASGRADFVGKQIEVDLLLTASDAQLEPATVCLTHQQNDVFIGSKGRIEGKRLIADEVTVDSPQVNLSGQGEVDMERKWIDGKGLVAVLKPVDEVLARIPVISSMLTGSLVGIPIRVAGAIDRPEVTYLSPADVGVELISIPLRILGIPLGAMRLFTPSADPQDSDSSK